MGQQYEPVDKGSLLHYKESKTGVILEEGITEAGAVSSFIAAGTVCYAWYQYHTFLLLLFHVWLSAHRRLYLGRC